MHGLYSDYLHHYAKIKIIVFGFVFREHINKGLLLRRQFPGSWHAGCWRLTGFVSIVTKLTHLFSRFCTHRHDHNQPQ